MPVKTFFYKIIACGAIFFLIGLPVVAQTSVNDSLTFANTVWIKKNIAPGILLKQYQYRDSSLFHSNQHISIVHIDTEHTRFDIVADTILRTVSSFAEEYDAEAAINGSFFDRPSKGTPYNSVDYLRLNSENKAPNELRSGRRQWHQQGAIAIFQGRPYILKADVFPYWENYICAEDVLTSGPLLINDSFLENLAETAFNTARHPRTAVAAISSSEFVLIVVDGRFPQAAGMSLFELQKILHWMGATEALNLDGGGSSTLFVSPDGVINFPTDNKTYDHAGQRRVANALIVNSKVF